jgi:hypothetical protein
MIIAEAMRSGGAKASVSWREGTDPEIKALHDNGTFELVKRPHSRPVIEVK